MNDELVEALARNIFDLEVGMGARWDHTTESMREAYRDSIRKALDAVPLFKKYGMKIEYCEEEV